VPITLLLIVTQEMCSRMGAVTGKGLADLIREDSDCAPLFHDGHAGLRQRDQRDGRVRGIASSLELFHISKYVSVPLSAARCGFCGEGSYRSVEKIFLGLA